MKSTLKFYFMLMQKAQHIFQNIYRITAVGDNRITAVGDQRITADSDY